MVNRLIILLLALTFFSCSKDEFIFLIERPHYDELNNATITLFVDENEVYQEKLKYTNIASIYDETYFDAGERNYSLKVQINDTLFEYSINYPQDKYIIISPTFKDGKVLNGILKSDEKYNLQ